MCIYAIGDIHGHLDQLENAHRLIAEDKARTGDPDAPIVHLGDLVDRGPDSRGVIEYLMTGRSERRPWIVIKGNHDRMFTRFARHGIAHDPMIKSGKSWLHDRLGGKTTLGSYGICAEDGAFDAPARAAKRLIPEAHLAFLEALPLWHKTTELLFVHAGLRPGIALEAQTEDDLVWIREPFLSDRARYDQLVVHGHTPVEVPTHFGNRVNLDVGAGYGNPLVPVVFEGREALVLTDRGRVAVQSEVA